MKTITVDVTAGDIARGTPGSGCQCPVALAVERALPGFNLYVGPEVAYLGFDQTGKTLSLPDEARAFIARFDLGLLVEPFTFDLTVPGELAPAGAR